MRHSMRAIIQACADAAGVTPGTVTGQSRSNRAIAPRFAASRIAREQGLSLPRIGQALGGRDHSTIWNALGVIRRMGNRRPALLREILRIEALAREILAGRMQRPRPVAIAADPAAVEAAPRPAPGVRGQVRDGQPVRHVTRHGYVTRDGAIICNPW